MGSLFSNMHTTGLRRSGEANGMALKPRYYGSGLLNVEFLKGSFVASWRWWLLETYQVSHYGAFGLMRTEAKSGHKEVQK